MAATRFLDASGRTMTAGMLALLEGRRPDYGADPAPNSPGPDDPWPEPKPPRPRPAPEPEPEPEPEIEERPAGESRAETLRRLVAEGLCQADIARKLGVTPAAAWATLRAHGLKAQPAKKRGGSKDDQIRELVPEGLTQAEMADRVGLTGAGVLNAMRRLGVHEQWKQARKAARRGAEKARPSHPAPDAPDKAVARRTASAERSRAIVFVEH